MNCCHKLSLSSAVTHEFVGPDDGIVHLTRGTLTFFGSKKRQCGRTLGMKEEAPSVRHGVGMSTALFDVISLIQVTFVNLTGHVTSRSYSTEPA